MGVNIKPTQRYGVPVLGKQDEHWGIGANWEHVGLASRSQGFESPIFHQKLSGCIVSLVDGRAWNSEAAGAEPATQTRYILTRNAQRCAAGLLIRVRRLTRSPCETGSIPVRSAKFNNAGVA
jgi:hypothetical protein